MGGGREGLQEIDCQLTVNKGGSHKNIRELVGGGGGLVKVIVAQLKSP